MQRHPKTILPVWACVAGVLLLGGCPHLDMLPDGTAPPDQQPNVAAIATVVKHVYGLHGRGRMIFLGADEGTVDDEALAGVEAIVETDLGVRVLPESAADRSDLSLPALTPVDPETGQIGISIRLGRFRLDDEDRLTVDVGFARSGLDGAGFEYVLERENGAWEIIGRTETWVA